MLLSDALYFKDLRRIVRYSLDHVLSTAHNLAFRQIADQRFIIIDDQFPNLFSAFRITEFNYYLDQLPNAVVYTKLPKSGKRRLGKNFPEALQQYRRRFPEYSNRIFRFRSGINFSARIMYTVFLNNAVRFIPLAERHDVPFIFTLYPGGGFGLDNTDSDDKLRKVFSSTSFKRVIVTQKITHEYLLKKGFCPPEKIEFIYGGVFPTDQTDQSDFQKKPCYPDDKTNFDICFVAYKYTATGADKGFDTFIKVAQKLKSEYPVMRFHVVGNFQQNDLTDYQRQDLADRILFHGEQYTESLKNFYSNMDIIVSANVPFILYPGAFDGFPTGTCIEAGLSGVAVFCTDPLNQNFLFRNREEIVIIDSQIEKICSTIGDYYSDTLRLYDLARKGQAKFRQVFGQECQLKPRLEIISRIADKACSV